MEATKPYKSIGFRWAFIENCRPEGPDLRPDGPETLEFRPEGPEIRPEGPDLRPEGLEILDFRPEGPEIRPEGPEVELSRFWAGLSTSISKRGVDFELFARVGRRGDGCWPFRAGREEGSFIFIYF